MLSKIKNMLDNMFSKFPHLRMRKTAWTAAFMSIGAKDTPLPRNSKLFINKNFRTRRQRPITGNTAILQAAVCIKERRSRCPSCRERPALRGH